MAEPTVHGLAATINEYNVALALDKLAVIYYFQFAPWGQQGLRGQYIVDFWLPYVPGKAVIEVYGEYWHTGQLSSEDKLRIAKIQSELNCPVYILWGIDTETAEKALEEVRKLVGGVM